MKLEPREYFSIARVIGDAHIDTTTYYVQAKIYDESMTLLETVNLTDKGSGIFTKKWQTPADTSGTGKFVTIVTRVFTDSGYSSQSENHYTESTTYLVERRIRTFGGGTSVNYEKIERMFDRKLEERLGELPKPEKVEKVNLSAILDSLATLRKSFEAFVIPEVKFDAVIQAIQEVKDVVGKIPQEYADRSDLNQAIGEVKESAIVEIQHAISSLQTGGENRGKKFTEKLEQAVEKLTGIVSEVKEHLDKKEFNVGNVSLHIPSAPEKAPSRKFKGFKNIL